MKLPEHVALSFLLAQFGVQQEFGATGTALVVAAGVLPDLDGLSLLGGWQCHRKYHRVVGHSLPLIIGGPLVLTLAGARLLGDSGLLVLWYWLQLSLLAHLATDVIFYNWPVQLIWPLSRRGWAFSLVTWNDLVPTLLLYGGSAVALVWPTVATATAAVSLGGLALYLGWRAWQPRARSGWSAWLTGGWARRSPRWLRWLTGDVMT